MTIREYCAAAAQAAGAQGNRFKALTGVKWQQTVQYISGDQEPSVTILMRLENATGISLDEIDPRIKRGWALAPEMVALGVASGLSGSSMGRALDVTGETWYNWRRQWQNGVRAMERLFRRMRVGTAIRIPDAVEWLRGLKYEPQADAPPAAPQEPERDEILTRARTAIRELVDPDNFELTRLPGGKYAARTEELFDIEIEVLPADCVLTVYSRRRDKKTGVRHVWMERRIGA